MVSTNLEVDTAVDKDRFLIVRHLTSFLQLLLYVYRT